MGQQPTFKVLVFDAHAKVPVQDFTRTIGAKGRDCSTIGESAIKTYSHSTQRGLAVRTARRTEVSENDPSRRHSILPILSSSAELDFNSHGSRGQGHAGCCLGDDRQSRARWLAGRHTRSVVRGVRFAAGSQRGIHPRPSHARACGPGKRHARVHCRAIFFAYCGRLCRPHSFFAFFVTGADSLLEQNRRRLGNRAGRRAVWRGKFRCRVHAPCDCFRAKGRKTTRCLRPFAGNASLYAAIQVGPTVLDYLWASHDDQRAWLGKAHLVDTAGVGHGHVSLLRRAQSWRAQRRLISFLFRSPRFLSRQTKPFRPPQTRLETAFAIAFRAVATDAQSSSFSPRSSRTTSFASLQK